MMVEQWPVYTIDNCVVENDGFRDGCMVPPWLGTPTDDQQYSHYASAFITLNHVLYPGRGTTWMLILTNQP